MNGSFFDTDQFCHDDEDDESGLDSRLTLSFGMRMALLVVNGLVGLLLVRFGWNPLDAGSRNLAAAGNPVAHTIAESDIHLNSRQRTFGTDSVWRDMAKGKVANGNLASGSVMANVPADVFDPNRHPDWELQTLNIEQIRVGMRVPAFNPQMTEQARSEDLKVDPRTWRKFTLSLDKEDGSGQLEVSLLRPATWFVEQQQWTGLLLVAALLEDDDVPVSADQPVWARTLNWVDSASRFDPAGILADQFGMVSSEAMCQFPLASGSPSAWLLNNAADQLTRELLDSAADDLAFADAVDSVLAGNIIGSEVFLDMPELGAVGMAEVVAVEATQAIEDGPGRIVTATFKHESANVLDLRF